jgi:hypothetical protein
VKEAIDPGIVVNPKKKKTKGKDYSLLMKGEEGFSFSTLYTRWKKSDELIHIYWMNLAEDMIAVAGSHPDWFKKLTAFLKRVESITTSSHAYEGRMSFDMVKTNFAQITREGVIGDLQKVEASNTDHAGKSVATGSEHRETSTFDKFIEKLKEFYDMYLAASGVQQALTDAAALKAARNSQFTSKAKSTMKGKAGGGGGAASGGNGNGNEKGADQGNNETPVFNKTRIIPGAGAAGGAFQEKMAEKFAASTARTNAGTVALKLKTITKAMAVLKDNDQGDSAQYKRLAKKFEAVTEELLDGM